MKRLCPNCQQKNNKHEYQDSKNGLFVRVFNEFSIKLVRKMRCTVCGFEIVPETKKEKPQEEKATS